VVALASVRVACSRRAGKPLPAYQRFRHLADVVARTPSVRCPDPGTGDADQQRFLHRRSLLGPQPGVAGGGSKGGPSAPEGGAAERQRGGDRKTTVLRGVAGGSRRNGRARGRRRGAATDRLSNLVYGKRSRRAQDRSRPRLLVPRDRSCAGLPRRRAGDEAELLLRAGDVQATGGLAVGLREIATTFPR